MNPTEIKILVVDDDAAVAQGTAHLLKQAGYDTATAGNGVEGLQLLPGFHPNLVLSDRDMTEMDGMELCRRIKGDSTWADVFVVLISGAFTQSEEQAAGLDAGDDGYIARPIADHELLARVAAFGRIVRLNQALRASEAHYRAVTDSAIDAIVTLDGAGNIVDWNRGAQRRFGYEEGEIRGPPLDRIIPARFPAGHHAGLERMEVNGERHVIGRTVELAGLRRDGTEFPLELALSESAEAGKRFFTGIMRDTSDRKRAEAQIGKMSAAVEQSPASIVITDLAGNIEYTNAAFSAVTGYSREEALGHLSNEQLELLTREFDQMAEPEASFRLPRTGYLLGCAVPMNWRAASSPSPASARGWLTSFILPGGGSVPSNGRLPGRANWPNRRDCTARLS